MKKNIASGLVILLPLVLTIWVFMFLIHLFTAPFLGIVTPLLESLSNSLPILKSPDILLLIARVLILILLVIFIFFLGVVARWFFFRTILTTTNSIFTRIPIIKFFYTILKEVSTALITTEKKKLFQRPVIVSFPTDTSVALGFISGNPPEIFQSKIEEKLLSVFVPTSPHPITGFLMMIPEKNITEVDMTNEEAFKFLVSCGIISEEEVKNDL